MSETKRDPYPDYPCRDGKGTRWPRHDYWPGRNGGPIKCIQCGKLQPAPEPTWWQAELYKDGREYDLDFPRRATADEALADGREAMGRFTPAEREHIDYQAVEYTGDDQLATNTGRVAQEAPR